MNMLSGATGLTGAVDSVYVLHKEIQFDGERHIWDLVSEAEGEVKLDRHTDGCGAEFSRHAHRIVAYAGLLAERGFSLHFRRSHDEKIVEIALPASVASGTDTGIDATVRARVRFCGGGAVGAGIAAPP
ncbi:MAG: hypothetical protein LBL35_08305 [Clostridiales bacterium]|nr:hypothetical protein [Clostridiales bacterium]